ncbi:protein ORF66 [Lake sturgeon herpesvirus]|nr:protein ORF66 [Lake sturgeon herpesvirus]
MKYIILVCVIFFVSYNTVQCLKREKHLMKVIIDGLYFKPPKGNNKDCDKGYCITGTCYVINPTVLIFLKHRHFCICEEGYMGPRCDRAIIKSDK